MKGLNRAAAAAGAVLVVSSVFAGSPAFGRDALRIPAALAGAGLLAAAACAQGAREGRLTLRRDPLKVAATIFVLWTIAAWAVAGARAECLPAVLMNVAGLAVYARVSNGRTPEVVPLLALGALGTAAWAVLQWAGGEAATGVFGNTNDAGAALAMLAPLLLGASMSERRGWAMQLCLLAALACVAALAFTHARGAWAAGAAGVLVLAAGSLRRARWPILVLAAAGVAAVAAYASTPSMEVRRGVWRGTVAMIRDHAAFGVGPGRFRFAFPPYRDPAEFELSNPKPGEYREVDDAHDGFLQIAADAGAPALALFALVAYMAARRWLFFCDHADEPRGRFAVAGLGGAAAAFGVACGTYALPAHAAAWMLLWLALGLLEQTGNHRPLARPHEFRGWVAASGGVQALLLAFGTYVGVRAAVADYWFERAMRQREAAPREAALAAATAWDFREWRAQYEIGVIHQASRDPFSAASAFEAALRVHENHALSAARHASALAEIGRPIDEVEARFEAAIRAAPRYYLAWFLRGVARYKAGDFAPAAGDLAAVLSRHPGHGTSHLLMGFCWWRLDRPVEALSEWDRARELNVDVAAELVAQIEGAERRPLLRKYFGP